MELASELAGYKSIGFVRSAAVPAAGDCRLYKLAQWRTYMLEQRLAAETAALRQERFQQWPADSTLVSKERRP